MRLWSWGSWDFDLFTIGWALWLLFFIGWETAALIQGTKEELTAHLRPIFLSQPLTWFLALGLWMWLGYHFLLEAGTPFIREIIDDVTP